MKRIGLRVKKSRLANGLTQKELAKGICAQATISHLEKGNSQPSLALIVAIYKRLGLKVDNLYAGITTKAYYTKIYAQVRTLISQQHYQESLALLTEKIKVNQLENPNEIKQYHYYYGINTLLGYHTYSDAFYHFSLTLLTKTTNQADHLDLLATNGMGVAYLLNSEPCKAHTYFKKSEQLVKQSLKTVSTLQASSEIVKIYYTLAKYYSRDKEYNKSVEFCEKGIKLQNKHQLKDYLGILYYEKGFNLKKLNRLSEAEDYLVNAFYAAKESNNQCLMDVLKNNQKNDSLDDYPYW
ncbi:XRE family transcriptional regulator [Carnobacterium maltaromaticum]|uniref:helix-turn-helix domain-containing protein n=1 Tax=Carnobacterium maltaromaticum TaxID=2751 RepID=UPI000C7627DB|nr:helix-turn-helix domain-containing protein [Carnobacterium maltaromaticum]PLS39193.1 XRE family transcriptional regulator [Carnobacterium maltaromaticum]PLS40003.1 XRE family transcriptional regulator [Carnobacterium maltaromaticum]PLS40340.1 XRE family transcriptional regulator [Carnobacterium maltaromaticum]PLS45982.1 XRE family transcriptional regulator [Carnobacterium maltaromaticum]PLS47134.1 XRE family transcriptional regulator [Carnobacterium maltaromaticum]